MATAAKKQFGSKVAKRVAARQATDKLPKPAIAKTADKTSVPVKKPAVKRVTRATPASQTGLVNDPAVKTETKEETVRQISARLGGSTAKSDVSDPAAKVATPSTAKRISRSNKRALVKLPTDAEQIAATKKAEAPAVKKAREASIAERQAEAVRATPAKKVAKPKVGAVKSAVGVAKVAKPVDAVVVASKKVASKSDIAPAAKKAIKKAADALKAPVVKKPAVKRVKPSGELTQAHADLTFEASQPSASAEAKKNLDLLNRFDALVKEIRAAGGKLNGDLQLAALIFNYREPVKKAKSATERADAGLSLKKRARALIEEAKAQGWDLTIAQGLIGDHVVLSDLKK